MTFVWYLQDNKIIDINYTKINSLNPCVVGKTAFPGVCAEGQAVEYNPHKVARSYVWCNGHVWGIPERWHFWRCPALVHLRDMDTDLERLCCHQIPANCISNMAHMEFYVAWPPWCGQQSGDPQMLWLEDTDQIPQPKRPIYRIPGAPPSIVFSISHL